MESHFITKRNMTFPKSRWLQKEYIAKLERNMPCLIYFISILDSNVVKLTNCRSDRIFCIQGATIEFSRPHYIPM